MSDTHFRGRIAQKALLTNDGKILVTRDSRDDKFELPGGRLDDGEEPKEGILREIREELGVEVKINKIFDIQTRWHGRDDEMMIFIYYLVSLIDETAEFTPDSLEVAEMQWVDMASFTNYSYYEQFQEVLESYFNKINS